MSNFITDVPVTAVCRLLAVGYPPETIQKRLNVSVKQTESLRKRFNIPQDPWVTVNEAAQLLNVNNNVIYTLCSESLIEQHRSSTPLGYTIDGEPFDYGLKLSSVLRHKGRWLSAAAVAVWTKLTFPSGGITERAIHNRIHAGTVKYIKAPKGKRFASPRHDEYWHSRYLIDIESVKESKREKLLPDTISVQISTHEETTIAEGIASLGAHGSIYLISKGDKKEVASFRIKQTTSGDTVMEVCASAVTVSPYPVV